MNRKIKFVIPVIAGVVAISTGFGVVAAANSADQGYTKTVGSYQTAGTNDTTTGAWYCGGPGQGMGGGLQITPQVATLLGTTVGDIQSQLSAGKTLAEIAAAGGISQEQLIQAVIEPYQEHLDLMVKYGYLTQDQANSLLVQARETLQTRITTQFSNDGTGRSYGAGAGCGLGNTRQPGVNPVPGSGFGGMMGGSGRGMMNRW